MKEFYVKLRVKILDEKGLTTEEFTKKLFEAFPNMNVTEIEVDGEE